MSFVYLAVIITCHNYMYMKGTHFFTFCCCCRLLQNAVIVFPIVGQLRIGVKTKSSASL